MKTKNTLMLAVVTALSLGAGAAMAQESPGDGDVGPYQLQQLAASKAATAQAAARPASVPNVTTLYGSSNHTDVRDWPVLQGGDGTGP
jgi:hypothetical protein